MSRVVGYCLECEAPIYLVCNASHTFQFPYDHMHVTEIEQPNPPEESKKGKCNE